MNYPMPFDQASATQDAAQRRARIAQAMMPDMPMMATQAPQPVQFQPSDLLMRGMAKQMAAARARRALGQGTETSMPVEPGMEMA